MPVNDPGAPGHYGGRRGRGPRTGSAAALACACLWVTGPLGAEGHAGAETAAATGSPRAQVLDVSVACSGAQPEFVLELTAPTDFAAYSDRQEIVLSLPTVDWNWPEAADLPNCGALTGYRFERAVTPAGGRLRLAAAGLALASVGSSVAAGGDLWSLRLVLVDAGAESSPRSAATVPAGDPPAPGGAPGEAVAPAPVRVLGLRYRDRGDTTRIVLDLSAAAGRFRTGRLGNLLFVQLGELDWAIPERDLMNSPRIRQYVYADGRLRLEGMRPLAWRRAFRLPPEGARGHRLVLDAADAERGALRPRGQ